MKHVSNSHDPSPHSWTSWQLPAISLLALLGCLAPIQAQETTESNPAAVDEPGAAFDVLPNTVIQGMTVDGTDRVFTMDRGSILFGPANLRETPFTVNVIGEEDIVRRQSKNLGDILELDPATSPTYFANGVVPVSNWGLVRGYHNNEGFIDGMPILDNDLSQIEMLERVEILRGPGSFRFGFTAPGGVISLTTKRPAAEDFTAINTSYDSWGMYYGHLDSSVRGGENDELGIRVNLAGQQGGTWAGDAFTNRYLLGLSLDYRLSEKTVINANFSNSYAHAEDVTWGDAYFDINRKQLPIGPRDSFGQDWQYNQSKMTRGFIRLDSALTDNLDLVIAAGTSRADWKYRDFWTYDIMPNGDTIAGGRNVPGEHNYTIGNTGYLNYRVETGFLKHNLTGGYMLEKSDVSWSMEGFPDTPWNALSQPRIPLPGHDPALDYGYEIDGKQIGGFFSDQVDIGDRLHGVVGMRYSNVKSQFSEPTLNSVSPEDVTKAFSWMVGGLYDLTDSLGVYANYATGVEPGQRAPNDATNPGQQLGPIESFQVEGGTKWTIKEHVATLDANVFYIEQGSQFYLGPNTEFRDQGTQRHVGTELLAKGRFWEPLVLTGGVQYLDPRLIDAADPAAEGDRPVGVPRIQAVLDATLDITPIPGLSVSGTILHTGDRELNSPNDNFGSEAYTRFDLGAGYEFTAWEKDWNLFMRVENVFDKEYLLGTWTTYGAPRTYTFGFGVRF